MIGGLLRGSMYILMALGLSLVFGVMKIPNFAHGEFYMVGAYLAFYSIMVWELPALFSFLIAAAGGFILGVFIEKTVFYPLRKRSKRDWVLNSFLVTAGLSFILQNLAQALIGVEYKGVTNIWPGSLKIASINVSNDRIVGFVVAITTVALFWLFLKKSKVGNAILAVSENETGATLIGVDLNRIHTLTFALSCTLAAVAGAALLSIIPAFPTMGLQPLMKSWLVVILVGMGNLGATMIGGLAVGLIETFASYYFGVSWQDVISVSLIVLVLIFKPSGIFGKKQKV